MDQRITQFISALRANGVRISLAETADAFLAIDQLGIQDRETFRNSLRATLIKEQRDIPAFEKLFPMFFQPDQPPPMTDATQNLTRQEAEMLAQALRNFNKRLRDMMEKMIEGEPLTPEELAELDEMINGSQMNDLRYQNWMARQLEQAMQFKEVRKALEEMMRLLNEMGMNRQHLDRLRQAIQANQRAMQEQLRQHAGEQILQNMVDNSRHEPRDGLLNRPFQSFSEDDMRALRQEVRRLAAALRTRLALRLKRARSGQLDLKATMRANLKHGSVPIELRHRDHTRKPKLVVICDISTSMRYCSELMLGLIYAIQDQISKTHAFTFIDHLEYVSPHFDHNGSDLAINQVLRRMPGGHYNTDLGHSLQNFTDAYMETVDHRTTFIVVGDGRNNFNDPRLDAFRDIARRARATIWLNPEPPTLWGTGDSDMPAYATLCDRTFQVNNLNQLASAIDQLLLH
ncbi:MAG TPA: VWA domain-containing protein [Anaerolinea sp.]|nr:VWA domain-containing protein [Anaerolinea sp.]